MNLLVSYAETSSETSDDEEKYSTYSSKCGSNSYSIDGNGTTVGRGREINNSNNDNNIKVVNKKDTACPEKMVNSTRYTVVEDKHIIDLPITDESDDQSGELVCRDNELYNKLVKCKSANVKGTIQTENVYFQNKVVDDIISHSVSQNNMHLQAANSDKLTDKMSHISKQIENVNEADITQTSLFTKDGDNFTEVMSRSVPIVHSSESESAHVNRKRKLNSDSNNQLQVPDSIHSMYHGKQQRWLDNPAQHHDRIRSFPHVQGNWATHAFIPVVKNEPFARFVDCLLKLLMPPTFEVLEDFHVSLSRTVTIRYHWMEPLVDSLRENLKCLKSCISDFLSVKLFTNDEKTRTFVSIELSQDDREFLDFVKAVDKSFAEFKLPAYYENPSFHISVGWCLGDVVGKITDEKLSTAQDMLGDFIAANPDLSFVYVHQVCCQSGCKSFVIPLQDSVM